MQSAYDRDDYVTIHWENITPGTEHNFNKYTNAQVSHFNQTYDYLSVMHYGAYGFSKNGNATIEPIVSFNSWQILSEVKELSFDLLFIFNKDKKYLDVIGQRKRMSDVDIIKLNAMYECDNEVEDQEQPED